MSLWSKILTALRGGASEAGEAIVDSQALRILDQEIRDTDRELTRSKQGLVEIVARRGLSEKTGAEKRAEIARYETNALATLQKGEQDLARDVAGRIAQLEAELAAEEKALETYRGHEATLRQSITKAEASLRTLKSQVDTVKATATVQRARASVTERHAGANSAMQEAMATLDRIKARQREQEARMDAADEIARSTGGEALDTRLRQAGVLPDEHSADRVLARLTALQPPLLAAPVRMPVPDRTSGS